MAQTLALIHTSKVFLTVETMMQGIFAEVMPDVRLINIMDDSLLPDVMAEGRISPPVVRRMCAYVMAAEATGADAVLSLCSSLGPTIDVARKLVDIPVIKIDDAHTEKAAREADRIGVIATVATTLPPTVALIREKAAAIHKNVEIRESLSNAAFEALMRGRKQARCDGRAGGLRACPPGRRDPVRPGIDDPVGAADPAGHRSPCAHQPTTGHRVHQARAR